MGGAKGEDLPEAGQRKVVGRCPETEVGVAPEVGVRSARGCGRGVRRARAACFARGCVD